jgi:hypothetical protein
VAMASSGASVRLPQLHRPKQMRTTAPSVGPISPELVLVDPELRALARLDLLPTGPLTAQLGTRKAPNEPPTHGEARSSGDETAGRRKGRLGRLVPAAAVSSLCAVAVLVPGAVGGFNTVPPELAPAATASFPSGPGSRSEAEFRTPSVPGARPKQRSLRSRGAAPKDVSASISPSGARNGERRPRRRVLDTRPAFRGTEERAREPAAPTRLRPPPVRRATVDARVVLSWKEVPGASYYNVIIWRDGNRVLDLWPESPPIVLPRRWKTGQGFTRLRPGRYLWFAYPGVGRKADGRFKAQPRTGVILVSDRK